MTEVIPNTSTLRPQELEAVYAISSAVAHSERLDVALDKIIRLTRPVFIFDNIVVYTPFADPGQDPEPRYARVIGRGRSSDGDLGWGEAVAIEVLHKGKIVTEEEKLSGWESDRLSLRYMLGLPLRVGEEINGALVFGRFGGPPYTPEQIHLSEFIATHIGELLIRQQLVERIASLEAERRLQKLQENFIATVTHELCTPLGFIKGYATTLLREDTNWDYATRREFLQVIDEESDRLMELIDNLLDSSRLQTGTLRMQMQEVRLDVLLHNACQRAASRYSGLNVQMHLDEEIVLQADSARLSQVMDNLLGNAYKYAPGSVVNVILAKEADRIHLQVLDQGPGIASEHLERLFERFYRVQVNGGTHGSGLGLYICREIIHAHGGEITAESQLGQGTTFHIYLPEKGRVEEQSG